ncbi:MAG: GFA family protein [Pseudomonadales bacterium]|nr:GFA family protein [Pseudomonadales bacterium]
MVMDEGFRIIGSESLKSYESSKGKLRYFCKNCGSQIYAKKINTPHVVLRLGSLDTQLDLKEQKHIWYSQKVSWFDLDSKIERCEKFE